MTKLKKYLYTLLQIMLTTATFMTLFNIVAVRFGWGFTVLLAFTSLFFLFVIPVAAFILWAILNDRLKVLDEHPSVIYMKILNTANVITVLIRLRDVVGYARIYGVQNLNTRQILHIVVPDMTEIWGIIVDFWEFVLDTLPGYVLNTVGVLVLFIVLTWLIGKIGNRG